MKRIIWTLLTTTLFNFSCDNDPGLSAWPEPYQLFVLTNGGSKFIDIDGNKIHYLEHGASKQEAIILLHGLPAQSFLWRDIMPKLATKHRVIALDFLGFGRSDRPKDETYTLRMHKDYLDRFITQKGLAKVHLVVHDLGGPIGLRWAAENPNKVASIIMLETLMAWIQDIDDVPEAFREVLVSLRTPGVGENLLAEQNIFLESLSTLAVSGLESSIEDVYRFGWDDPDDRVLVMLPTPQEFPLAETPTNKDYVAFYENYLITSPIPKLVIGASPGLASNLIIRRDGLPTQTIVEYAGSTFANTTTINLQNVGHFIQEDKPEELSQIINHFYNSIK